jgi:hypothetical protein
MIPSKFSFFIISAPIVGIVALILILLYQQLGVAAFIACGTTFLMAPLQSFFSGRFAKIGKVAMEFTDQIIKEILVGSQIVSVSIANKKREMPLLNRVNGLRGKEIESLGYAAQMKAWNQGIFFVFLALICIVGFGTFVAFGNKLLILRQSFHRCFYFLCSNFP